MPRLTALVCSISMALLTGCAALREPNEVAWQAMHAIDTAQTLSLTRDSRYVEVESAWLLGERPKEKAVVAWSVASSFAHAGITRLLIDNDHPKAAKIWQYVTLSSVCSTVGRNASIGIQIGGTNAGPDR